MAPECMALLLKGNIAKASHSGRSPLSVAINATASQLLRVHDVEDQTEDRRLKYSSALCDAVAYSKSPRQLFELLKTDCQVIGGQFDPHPHTLVGAAAVGDLEGLELLLKVDASHERMKSTFFGDARQIAARTGREGMLKVLIRGGSNPSSNDIAEALTAACVSGHATVVHFLLDSYSPANPRFNVDPEPAIRAAAYHGHVALVQTLLQRFHLPDIHKTVTQAAFAASSRGYHAVIQMLLENDYLGINVISHEGQNLLHLAARGGHARAVRFLLDHSIQYYEGRWGDPLYLAAINGHQAVVQTLLDDGKDINKAQGSHGSLLVHAARNGETAMIRFLVAERGFNLHDGSTLGETALEMAAERGHVETVRMLVGLGVNVDGCVDGGMDGPMLRALMYGQVRVVNALLGLGARKVDPSKTEYADGFLDGEYPMRLYV